MAQSHANVPAKAEVDDDTTGPRTAHQYSAATVRGRTASGDGLEVPGMDKNEFDMRCRMTRSW